jgi:hypothetical protein
MMWALRNRTAYAAERNWTRDKRGGHLWLVAVKATFSLDDAGAVRLADAQEPPLFQSRYSGKPGQSSLLYGPDLTAPKPATDLLVNGVAHARGGVVAPMVPLSVRAGALEKRLLVFGPRRYVRKNDGIVPSTPLPFDRFPLGYEWAFGGTDVSDPDPRRHAREPENPIGLGYTAHPARLVGADAHRMEGLHADPTRPRPIGFGAVDVHWSPRLQLAGTYDAEWERRRKPLLPEDYDDRFVSCAPVDQQIRPHLRGGEPIELVNLTRAGMLRFNLPKIYLAFTTFFGRRREEHRSKLATVIITPEAQRLEMVWQTSLAVGPRDVDELDQTQIREKRYVA